MRYFLPFLLLLVGGSFFPAGTTKQGGAPPLQQTIKPFLQAHCVDCHGPTVQKAGLRLDSAKFDLGDARALALWTKVHDRIVAGEMPPKNRERPPQGDLEQVTKGLHQELQAASLGKQQREGRVVLRRLNSTEYETTLHDLLAIDLPLKALLPEDNTAAGFDNIAAALDISATHLLCYQEAAEKALLAALPAAPYRSFADKKTGKEIVDKAAVFNDVLGKSAWLKGDALVLHARLSDYLPLATASVLQGGRYKISVSAYAINNGGKPLALAFQCRPIRERGAPEIQVCFDVPEGISTVFDAEFDMKRETNVRFGAWGLPDRYDFFMQKVKPPLEEFKGPGLVIEWVKIEGPFGPWPPPSYLKLFEGVPLKARSVARAEAEKKPIPKIPDNRPESHWQNYDPLVPASTTPREDADRLIRAFLPRALRRPVSEATAQRYIKKVHDRLEQKYSFVDAMIHGYKAILCSTDFLYLQEPGDAALTPKKDLVRTRLDDYAIASRLALFLWSSTPDEELLHAAKNGALSKPAALRKQVERMLNDPRAERFTRNFSGQWLDLRKFNDTTPDPQLYNEYDAYLHWSLPRETEAFFAEVLRHDRSLLEFVDADWSMLNERLARHYGIPDIIGSKLRKSPLPAASHRGGLLTHGSVLKVTADGTRTSPVLRGKWVLERILGTPPAPPPPDIPLFEPDIRGATTIREQLDKHRNSPACATCHVHIDPPGFALENFDAIGGWRDYYRATKPTKKGVVKGTRYFRGPDVEVGGVTADGTAFQTIDDYKRILLKNPDHIARNLTRKVLIYATGADVQFADREVVEQIVAALRTQRYGFRALIHEVTQSRVFLNK